MTFDRRVLASAVALVLVAAACGGSATQAPTATPGETATPAASQEPTQAAEPTATPEAQVTPEPTAPGAASDLEAMLPSEVDGVKFDKGSFDGASIPGGIPFGSGEDDFAKFLADNGKSLSDVKIAIATPVDTEAGGSLVMALQVSGVPADKIATFAESGMDGSEKTTIGGKEVYGAGMAGFGAYVYLKDDVVFYILAMGGPNLAEGIISQLP